MAHGLEHTTESSRDKYCARSGGLMVGGSTHDLIGTHYQQDVSLDKVFMDVAAYNERVMGPAHVYNVVDKAMNTAIARRSVAHITVPKDIQKWATEGTALFHEHSEAQRRYL